MEAKSVSRFTIVIRCLQGIRMTDKEEFERNCKEKDFVSALDVFLRMKKEKQTELLSELFQKSQYQKVPSAMSIIVRCLHKSNVFDDFYDAWLPQNKSVKHVHEGGVSYSQFFPEGTTRIMNAVSLHDPREIASVGLHWVDTDEQYQRMVNMVKNIASDPSNELRHNRIRQVADKKSGGFYVVKSDDNLGEPF